MSVFENTEDKTTLEGAPTTEPNTGEPTPQPNAGHQTVPLDDLIKMRKKKQAAENELSNNQAYIEFAKKMETKAKKSIDQLNSELDRIAQRPAQNNVPPQQNYQPPQQPQSNAELEFLKSQVGSTNKAIKEIKANAEFDSFTKGEEYRVAREHRQDIIDFAIEKDIPIKNATYALYGDVIARDQKTLSTDESEDDDSTDLLAATVNGGSLGSNSDIKADARTKKIAESMGLGAAEYNLFKNGTPANSKAIHDYYRNKNKK